MAYLVLNLDLMNAPSLSKLSGILAVDEIDFELLFATDVLGLRSLHYGYWPSPPPGAVGLAEFRRAQEAYSQHLLSFVPEQVRDVLDVGAGVGDNARMLASHGCRIHAISPDGNHAQFYSKADPCISFEQTRFEELGIDPRFDLILFSESHNYMDHEVALRRSLRFAKPGAHVLVSGMFRAPDRGPLPADFILEDHAYFRKAKELGYSLEQLEDITENVMPTMNLVSGALDSVVPLGRLGARYLRSVSPLKARALHMFGGRHLTRLSNVLAYYRERTDPSYFRTHMRYAIARLRCPPTSRALRLVPKPGA